jgi:hypothetical protein
MARLLDRPIFDRSASRDPPTRRRFGIPEGDFIMLLRLVWRIALRQPSALWPFCRVFYESARQNPRSLVAVGILAALYLHAKPFSRFVIAMVDRQIADIDAGRWQSPVAANSDCAEPLALEQMPAA